ncbi:TetR/AcrR family transcriptional regulator [Candidatus Symbiopectobacterium sp. 'North America']|uniref:TetR/AcrR family transcriptional regulator n=1 Tax=Candidatus Symbiopectobacterium sp. 'North America' TaxID=2794574 RepID=UPI001FD55668|nr:TetR/AcrR family transcriptional regulator [Candidatus Symbiopectobacterium sp. 'North America']
MARKQTIDSDQILDAAETVLLSGGVHCFTLDAVAAQAGISKGGLVYRFPSKDQLIQTLLERELTRFSHDAEQQSALYGETPGAEILGHISAIGQETEETASRAIGLLTALVHAPAMLAPVQTFYRMQLARLAQATRLTKRLRIAFLAAEEVFLLHGAGFAALSLEERQSMLDDICDEVRSAYSNPKTADKPRGSIQAYTPSSPPFPPTPAVAWLSANGVNRASLSAERRHKSLPPLRRLSAVTASQC